MDHGAVRSSPPPRRAGAGEGAVVDDSRIGGALMRTAALRFRQRPHAAMARRFSTGERGAFARTRVRFGAAVLAVVAGAACSRGVVPDAYGNVEATEVVVSAEAT